MRFECHGVSFPFVLHPFPSKAAVVCKTLCCRHDAFVMLARIVAFSAWAAGGLLKIGRAFCAGIQWLGGDLSLLSILNV